jgi:hypothetical protein
MAPADPQEFAGQHLHLSKVTLALDLKQILTTAQKHLDIALRCITLQDKQENIGQRGTDMDLRMEYRPELTACTHMLYT